MNDLSFDVNIEPTTATHQSSLRVLKTRGGRFFVGKQANSKIKRWLEMFKSGIAPYKPSEPIAGPLHVKLVFEFSFLKSTPKYKLKGRFYKTTRPDLDNMEKVILDTLVKEGFIVDDSFVVNKHSEKYHSDSPKISILIRKLT